MIVFILLIVAITGVIVATKAVLAVQAVIVVGLIAYFVNVNNRKHGLDDIIPMVCIIFFLVGMLVGDLRYYFWFYNGPSPDIGWFFRP